MAATPEKKVKDAVVRILKKYDVYYFFPATHGYGRSGVPDIICCCNGGFLAIECKAGNNLVTGLQAREMAAIHNAGGLAVVVREDNIDEVESMVKIMQNPTPYPQER
jgi:hypothetical protein